MYSPTGMEAGMRFSLRSMLIVTAVLAVYCALYFALPPGLSVFLLMLATLIPLPAAAIAGIVYGKSYVRAFFIGCISSTLWVAAAFYYLGMLIEENFQVDWDSIINATASDEEVRSWKLTCFWVHVSMIVCGLTVAGVRWLCLRNAAGVVATSTAPIEPQDKAELYTILKGRMAGSAAEEISAGVGRIQFLQEKTEIAEANAVATNR
jgi:hypothetical protein